MSITTPQRSPQIEQLLAEMERNLDRGRIPLSLYGDPEIHALELDRIFSRNWSFVAHESEIPAPGDYVLRYVAGGPWIVVRGEDGAVHVLFDSCRHRGSQLCRAEKGNATHFRCPYHGWTYKNDGALVGVPNRQQAYRQLDEREWSLLRAPHVDTYRGLIFICLDGDAPTLRAFLGDFAWYLDVHFGLTPGGLEVVGDPFRWIVPANWKSGAENFSGDSYHTQSLHRSVVEIGLRSSLTAGGAFDVHVTECSGHATSIRRAAPGTVSFWGDPPEVIACYSDADLCAEQFDLARGSITQTGTVFPNLSLIHTRGNNDPAKPGAGFLSLALWQPLSATETEVWRWMFVPKAAPASTKQRSYEIAVASFSPSGNLESDDTTVWTGIARTGRTTFARRSGAQLNYEMGLPGMSDARPLRGWPGPGVVYDSNLEEGVQRTFFRHWLAEMTRP